MVLGERFDPDSITQELGLKPDQIWKQGQAKKIGTKTSKYKWSGWKKFIEKEYENENLEKQIKYWIDNLSPKKSILAKFNKRNYFCILDCVIHTKEAASIGLDSKLIDQLHTMKLEIRIGNANV